MAKVILDIADSNMAGDFWSWRYLLEANPNGGFQLRSELDVFDCEDSEKYAEDIADMARDSITQVTDGADLYESLESMLSKNDCCLAEQDVESIAECIAELSQTMASQFRDAPETLEQREEANRLKAEADRAEVLRPYRSTIDNYLHTVSDHKLRYGYGSYRNWLRRFIEDFVIANGCLPTGEHSIRVQRGGASYSGGTHDFGELGKPTRDQ